MQTIARDAQSTLREDWSTTIIVVFSQEIDSAHMMALAARLARGERSELLAIYVIEVPYSLPPDADMEIEQRAALDALGAAETFAQQYQRHHSDRDGQSAIDERGRPRDRQTRARRT